MKRDKYDTIFSNLIREMYDYTCCNCSRNLRSNSAGLHCSHFFGRRKQSVRYDLDNALAHCIYCHRILGENPVDFYDHYVKVKGIGCLELLRERANKLKKWEKASKKTGYKGEKEDMYKHYKKEYEKVLDMRKEGVVGYIECVNWS